MFDSRSQRELHAGLTMWTELCGIAMVTGDTGVGKSITLRRFLWWLDKSRFHVNKLTYLPSTPVGLLRSMCHHFGLPHPIYFTWIVGLVTFFVVAMMDTRKIKQAE